jgi:hypothetical protein
MGLMIAEIQNTLARAARSGRPLHQLRVNSLVYARLLQEYPGGHPELPVPPIHQLSTDFGLIDVVVDDRSWVDVVTVDGTTLAASGGDVFPSER